ncbi:MAG TPA: ubiquinone/menaquinone biosynthesis methyltransferase [Candidatus Eisenbacteria bacterium]|nr:ubiquinone/menaquinone biosynthesis methyltransferase [Candidatus Eisenbacteria bacterium]
MNLIRPWPRDRARRRAYVDDVFERVAPQYDRLTRLLSFGMDDRWKAGLLTLLREEHRDGSVLDLATGTGAFPLLLRREGHRGPIVGVDRSPAMLTRARSKCRGADIRFVEADLNVLPFAPESFDVIVMGYGLRYLDDLPRAMDSVHRVLRPGGMFLTLDFGVPRNALMRGFCFSYLFLVGTLWGLVLHGRADTYWHIVESLEAYPGQDALVDALTRAGFGQLLVAERIGGLSVVTSGERVGLHERRASMPGA